MIIGNGKIYIDGTFKAGSLSFEKGIITGTGTEHTHCDIDAGGCYILPGFVDIHTHGAMGGDASDGDINGLRDMSLHYPRCGVTTFLATTMSLPEDELSKSMTTVRSFTRPENGAVLAGINLEGPFLSQAKKGAQAAESLRKPDYDMFCRLNEKSGGMIRLVTVAPEEDEGFGFIKKAGRDVTVSLGHTTADYDTARGAFEAGASHATHLFNAMPPLNHRNPGVVGAAMDCGATVELITDGVHIHPSVIRLVHRLFGKRMIIISDSIRSAGMPDGNYELGGQPVIVKDGKSKMADGTIAGSSSNLMEELGVAVNAGIPLEDVVYSLTCAPAMAAGLYDELGSLDAGKRADFILLNEDLTLHSVYIGGDKAAI